MGLRLSKKHGVNPTTSTCFFCGEPKDVILVGAGWADLKRAGVGVSEDGEMPNTVGVLDREPCPKCAEWMKQGIILISVRDGETDMNNPYRTGKFVVIKDEALREIVGDTQLWESIKVKRAAFMPDEAWELLGLPGSKSPLLGSTKLVN